LFKNLLPTHASTIKRLFVNAHFFALEALLSQMGFQNGHVFQVLKAGNHVDSVMIKHIFFVCNFAKLSPHKIDRSILSLHTT